MRRVKSSLTSRTKELLCLGATVALLIWLAGCTRVPPNSAILAGNDAVIRQAIARACPAPLTADELDAAADYVTAHPDAAPLIGQLDHFDQEARVCRGEEP